MSKNCRYGVKHYPINQSIQLLKQGKRVALQHIFNLCINCKKNPKNIETKTALETSQYGKH